MSNKPKFCPDCGADLEEGQMICQKCGFEVEFNGNKEEKYEIEQSSQDLSSIVKNPNWNDIEPIVEVIGTWAWIIVLINGILYLTIGVLGLILSFGFVFDHIWDIVGAIFTIYLGIYIIRPKFSEKCAERDWDYLLNDVIMVGEIRFPLMLIWSILLFIFGQWWAGAPVLIPAIFLLFMGPQPYKWEK
jgi:hypothetical protein